MSLVDRIKSLFSGSSKAEEPPRQPTEPNGTARQPTPEEIAAAHAATPAIAHVEPFSAEPEPAVQPAGSPEDLEPAGETKPPSDTRDAAP